MGAKKIVKGAKSGAESAKKKLPPGTNKSTLPQEERVTRSFGLKNRPIIDPQPEPNFPGIWDSPKDLAQQAADRVAPESEFLNRLFGVTREDLYEKSLIPGNVKGSFEGMDGPGKSMMAQRVMTPRNTQRMQDQLAEAQKYPELFMGMHGWYQFDPVYQRLLQLMPKDEADAAFTRLNHFLGMSSPGSEVSTEIQRGLAANYFNNRGAFDLFEQYGGMPLAKKQELMAKAVEDRNNYLMAHPELATIMGHPYHSTSQALPMSKFIQGGALDMDSPKVPLYIQASGSRHHPLGVQSDSAVPDAHFSRNIGMSDVRGGKDANRNASLKTPEAVPIVRWWRNDVTDPLGMQSVPGQAIAWGVGSKATGVESAIGAPKLELLSNHIARRAKETGLPLDFVRDQMLMGKMFNEGGSVKRSPLNQMRAPASFQRDLDQARRERAERDVADQRARSEMYDDLRFATQVPGAIGTLAMEGVDYARENPLQAAINTGQFAYDVFVPQSMTDVGLMLAGSAMGGPLAGPIVRAAPKIGRAIAPIIGSPVRRAAAGSAMIAVDPGEMGAAQNYNEGGGVKSRISPLVSLARGAARRVGEGTGYKGVPGKPATVEIPTIGRVETLPIPQLEDAAASYMRSIGRPGEHVITEYPDFDEDLARRLARAYDEMKHDPADPRVQRSYQALADETMAQLEKVKDSGLDIRFLKEGMDDPYARSPALGYADIIENNRLYTFPTDFGFGTTDSNAELLSQFKHPMLTKIGRLGDKDNAVVNDAFRVVHDAFGHFGPGNPFFRHKGEERAWLNHAPMYSPEARPAAAVELRGQNSYLNFGPHAEHNATASGADTIYADQKLGLMPEWAVTEKSKRKPVEKAEGGTVSGDNSVERAPLPKPETPTFDGMSFEKAFAAARRVNAPRFMWRGKPYTTELKRESARDIERRVERRIPQAPAPQQDEAAVREAEMPSRLYQRPAAPAYDAFGPPRPFLSAPEQVEGLMPYEGAAAPRLNPAQMQGALRRFGRMDMDPSSFAYRFARTMR